MPALVISDLHLGSEFCPYDRLSAWLEEVPAGTDLVLNGDIVHAPRPGFREGHLQFLEILKQMAADRRIVWVAGNHDPECRMSEPGNIEFKPFHIIGKDVIVAHGHHFECRIFVIGVFFCLFRSLYQLHLRLGGRSMHMARYAKKFPLLFHVFTNMVAVNAVRFARHHGCSTIACGHTHHAEDRMINGIRYINTGAWTEEPFYALFVDNGTAELKLFRA